MTEPTTADPAHEFEYTFDRKFIRDGLRRDVVWRTIYVVAALLVFIALFGWLLGTPPWEVPVLPGLIAAPVAAALVLPMAIRKLTERTFSIWISMSPERRIRFRLHDECIEVVTPGGTHRHAWAEIRRLWRYHDVWLVEIMKNFSIFVPADGPPEALAFIEERCRSAGKRI